MSLNALLHRLWTKAVGAPGYDKEEWKELEAKLHALQTALQAHVEWEAMAQESQSPEKYFTMMGNTTDALLKARGDKR